MDSESTEHVPRITTNLHFITQTFEQRVHLAIPKCVELHHRKTVLPMIAFCDLASKVPSDFLNQRTMSGVCISSKILVTDLKAVADSKDGNSELEYSGIDVWRVPIIHRIWRTRQDDS